MSVSLKKEETWLCIDDGSHRNFFYLSNLGKVSQLLLSNSLKLVKFSFESKFRKQGTNQKDLFLNTLKMVIIDTTLEGLVRDVVKFVLQQFFHVKKDKKRFLTTYVIRV